jgi:membrane protein implicated in regulation of membrane protease activity
VGRQAGVVLYVLAMVAVVVGADILFLRHNFWARLIVNVGIVLVFAAFYFRFLKRPQGQPPQDSAVTENRD